MNDRPSESPRTSREGLPWSLARPSHFPAKDRFFRPSWGIWESLLVVVVFAISQPFFSLMGSFALSLLLPPGPVTPQTEDDMFKVLLPGVILFSHLVGWSGLYTLIRLRHHLPFFVGLRFGNPSQFRVVRIFAAGMALQALGVAMALLVPPPEDLDNPMLRFMTFGRWAVFVLFIMAVFLAPFLEEALFRGVLFPALRRRLRFPWAALLVTAVFTALHGIQTSGYWPALGLIFICGWILAYLREASGHLWPPVLFHMGFNFTALLPILLLGGEIPEGLAAWLQ